MRIGRQKTRVEDVRLYLFDKSKSNTFYIVFIYKNLLLDTVFIRFRTVFLIINQLNKKGVIFKSIKDNLTFNSSNDNSMDKFFLHILAAVSELERALI
ncbi:MAG: hypothetical protein D8B60_12345, partial [Moraxella sp.]